MLRALPLLWPATRFWLCAGTATHNSTAMHSNTASEAMIPATPVLFISYHLHLAVRVVALPRWLLGNHCAARLGRAAAWKRRFRLANIRTQWLRTEQE